jgi:MHS family alpha-ketoglutarate permease-like MFS transporter
MTPSIAILVVWQLSLAAPLFRKHPTEVAMVFGLTAAGSLAFYAYTTYMPKFLVNTAGFTKDLATAVSAASLLVYMCAQPIMGHLSDKVGRKTTLTLAFGLGMVFTYPIFQALSHTPRSFFPAFFLVTALVLIHSGYSAVSAVVKAELFPTAVRAMGVALPYAIANTVFGGTAEYVALWFKSQKLESGFYIYVAAIMAIALVISLRIRNTNATSLIEED